MREDEHRKKIVQTTHHLIAITQDLLGRIWYVRKIFNEAENYPLYILPKIAASIEDRYETLLERDAYQYLPASCVDIITRISGNIYGISIVAQGIANITTANSMTPLLLIPDIITVKSLEALSPLFIYFFKSSKRENCDTGGASSG
ncbi:hypothetical protein SAMN05421863_102520 [Nitrosomonas communis]|uniref:Uncharacterized protein n=1 Tax=Nitrosomonas communis TaxID=44574 RepID=A0A1I4Q7Q1_9PROT|nr:hypothetical protein SAMN05421863_102520 [Nitrosomonas communis]